MTKAKVGPTTAAAAEQPNNKTSSVAGTKSTLILSRSGYRAGGKVVGTILIENVAASSLQSVDLIVVGYCRLDSRWHKSTAYPFPPDHMKAKNKNNNSYYVYWDLPKASNVFWTSEMTDLLPTPTYPEHVSQRPADLLTPQPLNVPKEEEVPKMEVSRDLQRALSAQKNAATNVNALMSYSFTLELPTNLPPTISATSCRYHYAVLHRLRFKSASENNPSWKECPFSVLTMENDRMLDALQQDEEPENLQSHKPRITAVSHGDTVLCTLKSTEIHDSSGLGQVTVHCNGPTMLRPVSLGSARDCQSMRVSDPSGKPVTVLTVLGASKLSPGGRIILQFDFPDSNHSAVGQSWAPCYQASACLQGEEIALQMETPTRGSAPPNPKRSRARKLLLSTAHEVLDPLCTERVCLSLLVPCDAPCSMSTSIVNISIWCVVDLTVGTTSSNNGSSSTGGGVQHQNLRLEIPCRLGHPKMSVESQADEDERIDDFVDESVDSFYSVDVRRDLRQLSYAVIDYFRSKSSV